MAAPKKPHREESSVLARKHALKDRVSATQVLSAAEMRAQKGRRAGESSVILREGERIRRAGLGVSVKFALAISVAIAVFMLLFGIVIYNNVKGSLNDEIDAAGILAAKAVATPEFFIWNEFHGAFEGTTYARYQREIAAGERKIAADYLTEDETRRANEIRQYNRSLLENLIKGTDRLLDVLISNQDRTKIERLASGRSRLEFDGRQVGERNGVAIEYGTYTPPDGEPLRARSFVASIRDRFGGVEGKATVVLSEASIQENLARVRTQVLVLAIVFIALGVGVSFLMGGRITSPITALTQDVEVIARGNLDHHPRVITKDEIGVLARTVERMARSLKEAQEAEVEHQRQKHQLQVALEIQASLFPEKLPEVAGYETASHYLPGPEVGGDYYDVFLLPDGRPFVMVASASGKGIPAAMLTAMARSFTTAVAERESSASNILKVVNRLLSPDLRRGMYVTALACILEPQSGKLIVANAGHNPLILFSGREKKVQAIHSDGIALGFDKGPVFDRSLRDLEINLEAGDRIVLCTPGVFGITNHEGKELGEENFYRLVAREGAKDSAAFVNLMHHLLEKYTEGGMVESDITFVTLKRLA
ncbi:MAG: SpoIIE family protein phosphatase [Planctomycetes bacterium]|nr:SpoIIE family protein phosphatase [Planctomycetota bacterium]